MSTAAFHSILVQTATAFQLSGNVMRKMTAKITQMKTNVVGRFNGFFGPSPPPPRGVAYPELSFHTVIVYRSWAMGPALQRACVYSSFVSHAVQVID